ncbi:ABC transporter permease [Saccharomonospora sp. NPDC046836]|uniref:ABC transporter permease n=1 Tax=Saccharomonospora sp. NPDC046836 TaxID=3156921 RepID=UPI0033DDD0E3
MTSAKLDVAPGEPSPGPLRWAYGSAHRWLGRHWLLGTMLRRALTLVPLLLAASAINFILISFIPGDAARDILGDQASAEAYAALRQELGLDLPLWNQYTNWLGAAVRGDLGTSLATNEDVVSVITERLPVTLWLMVGALLVIAVAGIVVGVLSAVRRNWISRLIDIVAMIGFATPSFWIGALLISWLSVSLGLLPASGYVAFGDGADLWLQSLILPVAALGLSSTATVAKQVREAMAEIMGSEYVRMALASGVSYPSIIFRHALKNAAPRAVTVIGLSAVSLVGGAVLVEALFALPGLGLLSVTSVQKHDLPMIQGLIVYFAVMVVAINVLVDVSYAWLNPKVRKG